MNTAVCGTVWRLSGGTILNLTVILCPDGLPSSDSWTAELKGAGLDIEVHPTQTVTEDWLLVPMSVRGHLAILWFNGVKSLNACRWWFPTGIPTIQKPECVYTSQIGSPGVERERVAAWAAVASLPKLTSALVFDRKGIRKELVEIAYDMALQMIVSLPPRPHQKPGDPNLDFRQSSARRYDDGIDREGGDREESRLLEEAAFQAVEERRQRRFTR